MDPVEALLPVGWLLRHRRPDEAASIVNDRELATSNHITLTSPAFGDGQAGPGRASTAGSSSATTSPPR